MFSVLGAWRKGIGLKRVWVEVLRNINGLDGEEEVCSIGFVGLGELFANTTRLGYQASDEALSSTLQAYIRKLAPKIRDQRGEQPLRAKDDRPQ